MHPFTKTFPVDDELIVQLDLSRDELSSLRAEAVLALNCALTERSKPRNGREDGWSPWKVEAQLEGLTAHTRVHELAPTTTSSRIQGLIQANYMDVACFFRSETREEYFNVQKQLFPETIDAAVLYNVPRITNVSEGIKWAAYRPSWRRHPVDTCVFESTGTAVTADGQSYFYRVVIPTVHSQTPYNSSAKRVLRVDCQSVLIVSPFSQDASYSDVFMTVRTDSTDQRLQRAFMNQILNALHSMGSIASRSPSFKLSSGKWINRDRHNTCSACSHKFSMLRTKHECSLCGESVCNKCLLHPSQFWRGGNSDTFPTKFCTPCMTQLCEQKRPLNSEELKTSLAVTPTVQTRQEPAFVGTWNSEPEWVPAAPVCVETKATTVLDSEHDLNEARDSAMSLQSLYSTSLGSSFAESDISNEDPIYEGIEWSYDEEEESEDTAVITIDTREMRQMPSFRAFEPPSHRSSPSLFEAISSSIREQSKLLRQIQQVASNQNVRRNT